MSVRSLRLHLIALTFYGLLAFILLYAIIFNSGLKAPGFDYFNYNWNFWWIRHAISTPGLNVYLNDMVMAPHVSNFGYHALTAVWYPVWALLEPLIGTFHAMTVIIFLMCFLNGYVLFVLLRREGAAPVLALLGGALLQISPVSRYFYYNNHINLGDWFWLPASILVWGQIVRAAQQGRAGRALVWSIALGLMLWGIGHTDLQFPIFVAFWLVPYGLWTLWKVAQRSHPQPLSSPLLRRWSPLLILCAAGLIALILAAILLWFIGPLPYMRSFVGELAPGPVEDRPGIPFPRGYLSVDEVWWYWNTPTLGGSVTLLLLISLLVSLPAVRRRLFPTPSPQPQSNQLPRWFWGLLLLPPLILSMGPDITVFGLTIPMPFRLLHQITGGNFRMPWRLAPIFVAAAALFIARTWTPILFPPSPAPNRRLPVIPRHAVLVGVILLVAVDVRLYETAPLEDVLPAYQFYEEIGREQGEPYDHQVILEVPTGVGTGETLIGQSRPIQYQLYGMLHGKRMLNGFISRAPIENFWPVRYDDPLLAWLGQRRFLEPELVEPELRQIIFDWPIGYIVVHQDDIGRFGPTPQEIIGYLNSLSDLLCPLWVEADAVVYRTAWHPGGCPSRTPPQTETGTYRIDIGSSGDERYIGWGWHWQETVGAGVNWRWLGEYPQTRFYVDLLPATYQITLTAQAFAEPRQLRLLVDDLPLAGEGGVESVTVQPDSLQTFTFTLPLERFIDTGRRLTFTLDYDGVIVPRDIGQSDDPRKLALAVDWIEFRQQ